MEYRTEDVIVIPIGFIRDLQEEMKVVSKQMRDMIKELKDLKAEKSTVNGEQWMSADEAAAYLKVNRRKVNDYARQNIIAGYKTNKAWMFKRKDLDEYINRGFTPSDGQVEDETLKLVYCNR